MRTSEEVKQKTDIVEVVSQYVTLTKAGRLLKGLCPFHSEKHGSFFVYPEQQTWHCFGACSTGGDVFSFVMKKDGLDFSETLRLLAERAGINLPTRYEGRADREKQNRLHQANAAAAIYFNNLLLNSPSALKARNYVNSRNISAASITDFQLGYSPSGWQELYNYMIKEGYSDNELIEAGLMAKGNDDHLHDRFHNMLMFPISDMKGRINGFGARKLDESQPKYINSPQTELFDKSAFPYGLNLAAKEIRKRDSVVIVEGYTDVITAHQTNFKNVVASMGTSVTEKQINSLKKLSRNIVFALDADSAGNEATLRGVTFENILGSEIKVVVMPEGKDPDDVIRENPSDWPKLIDSAEPLIDYIFDQSTKGLDFNTTSGKKNITSLMFPIMAEIKDDVRLDHYTRKFASLIHTDQKKVENELSKFKFDQKLKESGKTSFTSPIIDRSTKALLESPLEEYCLSLLLKYPELQDKATELAVEYFGSSENREILTTLKRVEDTSLLKNSLPLTLHQHLDDIMAISAVKTTKVDQNFYNFVLKQSPGVSIKRKFADCILALQEKFYQAEVAKVAITVDAERVAGVEEDELASLNNQRNEVSDKIRQIQTKKQKRRRELRR
jgi:DNA primase